MVVLTVVPANFVVAARGWIFFAGYFDPSPVVLKTCTSDFWFLTLVSIRIMQFFGEARFFQSLAYQPAYYRIKALSLPTR